MQNMNMKKFVTVCMLGIISFLLTTIPVLGTEQEVMSLELVHTYQSKEELQAVYPKEFREKKPIIETMDTIRFIDPKTGRIQREIPKEKGQPFTTEEKQRLNEHKPVLRKGTWYTISGDQAFLVQSEYISKIYSLRDTEQPEIRFKSRVLYNAQGEQIANLPTDVENIDIKQSPDNQYFIAYGFDFPAMSRFLWFYSTDGTLLKKHEITPVNTTKYSQNGEFVVAFGGLDNPLFYVFTKTGDIFYQGKYTDIIQDEEGTMLYGVFVSEHGDMMLLQTWREIQLWLTNGSILWKKSSFRADDCFFISQKNLIIATIYTGFLQDSNLVDSYTMQVLSLETGNVLDEIKEISKITVIDEHIFVTKDGKYYEYQIR